MNRQPIPHQRIVFVCTHERSSGPRVSCGPNGGVELRDRLKALVKEHGLSGRIRIAASGCMDVCEEGPNAMVFPDNHWVCGTSPDDAQRIFDEIRQGIAD